MSEIVRVPFHGDEILTVEVDGKPHVVLKPAIEAIGLDYWSQVEKVRNKSWAVTGQSPATGSDGKTYDMVTVDVRTFLMLLATIDERRVAKDVAPKLIAYQGEVADAIEAYWTKGAAINPRVQASELDLIIAAAQEMKRMRDQIERTAAAAIEAAEDARAANARIDAMEGRHGWFAALGYAINHNMRTDSIFLARFGKVAASIARADGIEPNKVQHAHFGRVNEFPEHVWDRARAALGDAA